MSMVDLQAEGFLQTRQLVKRFDDVAAVNEVSLSIKKGEIFALLGSSGCGKSTLLRMLAGFEKPTSGSVVLNGVDIATFPPYQRPINMMFQSYALFPHLSVWDNIAFGLKREGMAKAHIELRVAEMLKLVQLTAFAKRKPHQLSGGQQQRVALARSLAKKPQLLLLDEPLGALDKKLREQTQFELVNIIESVGVTCVMVTHDQEEAMTMASRIAVMSQGKVLQVGTPKEIYERPNCRFVADFIGNINLFEGRVTFAHPDSLEVTTDVGVMSVARGGVGGSVHGVALSAAASSTIDDIAVRTPVALAVRPERIRISKVRPDVDSNLFGGTVTEIAYFGSYSTLIVAMDGSATRVKITTTNVQRGQAGQRDSALAGTSDSDLTWGDVVFFWWDDAVPVLLTQ